MSYTFVNIDLNNTFNKTNATESLKHTISIFKNKKIESQAKISKLRKELIANFEQASPRWKITKYDLDAYSKTNR